MLAAATASPALPAVPSQQQSGGVGSSSSSSSSAYNHRRVPSSGDSTASSVAGSVSGASVSGSLQSTNSALPLGATIAPNAQPAMAIVDNEFASELLFILRSASSFLGKSARFNKKLGLELLN